MASPSMRDALRGARQVGVGDAALRLEALRQVGVGVQRDAVWPQFADLLHRAREALGRLLRQAVDEVGIDGAIAQFARALHQVANALEGLHAVHGLLHVGVEVLHAEAQPVEAERAEVRQARRRDGARVDLDGDLGVLRQPEGGADRAPSRG